VSISPNLFSLTHVAAQTQLTPDVEATAAFGMKYESIRRIATFWRFQNLCNNVQAICDVISVGTRVTEHSYKDRHNGTALKSNAPGDLRAAGDADMDTHGPVGHNCSTETITEFNPTSTCGVSTRPSALIDK
jgi:hypothetical protein